ncbi:hypothetical protein M9H77_29631 [Catharanthus roseus]|uniref:Uncharacterized protein n=1 Tax=Catharanthus roseus TaxID=4058 RepID=A0ACB9ZVR5_CATRO|nr:hypothetical protein M9H77_29631 [Catharanthus roseus]
MEASYDADWVMVVEYLESSMSRDLLGKFPDSSAFDFDYSQSSIWSPLVPRRLISTSSPDNPNRSSVLGCGLSKKFIYDEDRMGLTKIKKISAKIKKKLTDALFHNLQKYRKMKKRKKKGLDFSPLSSSNKVKPLSATPRKGWEKVLKAASKHFKNKNKRRDSIGHYPSHLTEADLT